MSEVLLLEAAWLVKRSMLAKCRLKSDMVKSITKTI